MLEITMIDMTHLWPEPSFSICEDTRLLLLLPGSTLVESQLLALEDVAVYTSTLAWSARHNSIQPTSLKLPLQSRLNLASLLHSLVLLVNHRLALLLLLFCLSLDLPPSS
jgi:hypothetical protein